MATFGDRIKKLRQQYNLTQTDIAHLISVSQRQIQRYESNSQNIPISKLVILADFFDISVDYLIGRSDKPERK